MKKLSTLILFLLCFSYSAWSQCTIDSSQTTPGIYPDTLPEGTAGQFYNEDVTFVMIEDTLGFTINSIQIVSITGLPAGINWACNSQVTNCTYIPANSIWGCINFSGLPLLPDTYTVTVNLEADIQLIGTQTLALEAPFIIHADSSSNGAFLISNPTGCSPHYVSFNAILSGQDSYDWDFGNGDSSSLEDPDSILFSQSGVYPVSLTTVSGDRYTLTGINIDSIPDAYGDFGGFDDADLYFLLLDSAGNTVFDSRPALNAMPPQSWVTNINLLNQTYTVEVWDEDGFPFGADDYLGSVSFAGWGSSGNGLDSIPGEDGILDLTYTIVFSPSQTITTTDTVTVYATPAVPVVSASGPLEFCLGDSVILTSNDAINQHQWYKNSFLLSGDTSASLTVISDGIYQVMVTGPEGCSSVSDADTVIVNPNPPKPNFFTNIDTLTSPLTGYIFQWYVDGNIIPGATGTQHIATVSGTYTLLATDSTTGCSTLSDPVILTGVGLSELSANPITVMPNPNNGIFNIRINKLNAELLYIHNSSGKLIKTIEVNSNEFMQLNLSNEPEGIYIISSPEMKLKQKIILQK